MLGERGVTKPLVVRLDGNNVEEGRRILAEADHPLVELVDTMDGAAHRAAELAAANARDRTLTMAIFLNENSKVIVQGMTGSEGTKHTQRMLASGTDDRRRRQPAQGRHQRRLRRRHASRCSAPSPRRWRRPAPTSSVVFVPPAVHQGRRRRGDRRRRSPLAVVITEGIPVHDTAEFFAYAAEQGTTRIIGPNCPGLISPGKSNAGIIPADITKPGRIGLVSQVGHADLPDDVRAARHRLLHRRRHRRRPGHRHDAHRLPRRRSRTTPRPTRS